MNVAKCAMGLLVLCTSAFGKDVVLYKISKGFHYEQTPGAPPTVLTNNGYVFEAQVFLPLAGTVSGSVVTSTEGTERVLALDGDTQFEFRNRVNSRSTLDTRYPEGPFLITINAVHDGRKIINLPITANTYPPVPRISNLTRLQLVNAHGYAVVRWDAFAGGNSQDFIQLRIEDSNANRVFETRDFGEIGALDGTATYAIVPPDTLKPGKTYDATLRFDKTSAYDTSSYFGAPGWSTHHAATQFPLVTSSAGTPNVKSYTISKGQRFDQTSADPPGRDLNDEFNFSAEVKATASDSVLSAVMSPPVGDWLMLLTDADESTYSDKAPVQALLDSAHPNGWYGFTIETVSQGTPSVSLLLTGDAYPPTPHLTNFDPTEPVRADRNLIFEWEPWIGGTANDFIQLHIEDEDGSKVFETKDFDDPGALHGRATWAFVPGGTFEPGKTYKARLVFTRVVTLDETSYPGALGTATYYSRTKFLIVVGPPDVASFSIAKGREFRQTGPATVVSNNRWTLNTLVTAASTDVVQSASLIVPGFGAVPLARQADEQTFSLSANYSGQAALDGAFPNGTYQLLMQTANDGFRTVTLPLTADGYPNPPMTDQFDALGQIFPFFDFIVSWGPFEGARSKDFIQFEILDYNNATVYRTGDYRQPDGMGGFSLAVVVLADSVQPNVAYAGRLRFEIVNGAEDSAYPGVVGRTGYASTTQWSMATLGDGNPTSFTGWGRAEDGKVEFVFPTVLGGTYLIEGSADLVTWAPVSTVIATEERTTFRVQPGVSHYFYRAALTR